MSDRGRSKGHSELSYGSGGREGYPPSEASYVSSSKRSGYMTANVDIAENPLCPRIKGLCCLIVLFNLAIILICLGFVVVTQLPDPPFAWWIGLFILIFGFVTLVGCFIYCFIICKEHKKELEESDGNESKWNHHWSKTMRFGEINYENEPHNERY